MVVHTELSKNVDLHKEPPILGVFSYEENEENARGEGRGTLQGETWERGKTPLCKTFFLAEMCFSSFSFCARLFFFLLCACVYISEVHFCVGSGPGLEPILDVDF